MSFDLKTVKIIFTFDATFLKTLRTFSLFWLTAHLIRLFPFSIYSSSSFSLILKLLSPSFSLSLFLSTSFSLFLPLALSFSFSLFLSFSLSHSHSPSFLFLSLILSFLFLMGATNWNDNLYKKKFVTICLKNVSLEDPFHVVKVMNKFNFWVFMFGAKNCHNVTDVKDWNFYN